MSDKKPASAVDDLKALNVVEQDASQVKAESERDDAAASYTHGQTKQTNMKMRIRSPFRTYYDGQAFSVTAQNATGPFDILPGHHNFVCLLIACEVIVRTVDGSEERFKISGGLLHVKTDQTIIFLDI